ncbi:ATP-binding cassette domain-containing protein [Candidatus Gracilibacteria bacterium]|nr:ATP-binding cassette domain-containing protein [Candidatus Gracilibacteria bacterium]
MLEFQNVSLSVGRKEVLQNISFSLVPGEIVAILGESGAGKSSIFRLLLGEWKPTLGSIKLDEIVLEKLSLENLQKYRRQIGVVFQDFRLLAKKTVFENIAFALEVCGEESKISKKVPELLKLVGLSQQKDQFPDSLSGGEKQRVAIARALVHTPKILIADEATGNLDPKNSREIAELFSRLHKDQGLTIVFASHDPTLVMRTNPRIIRLEKGRILFDEKNCPPERAFAGLL